MKLLNFSSSQCVRRSIILSKNNSLLTRLSSFSKQFHVESRSLSANNQQNESTTDFATNFGYKKVKSEEKQSEVNKVFSNVATKYDIMNDVMSFGLHRIWKNVFVEEIAPNHKMKFIDVAGGTGDIALRILNKLETLDKTDPLPIIEPTNATSANSQIQMTVCDINENMLNVGKEKSLEFPFAHKMEWKVGDAHNLANEKDNTYDVYTIAFGIRNCTHLDKVVKEAYRILKPGGRFLCLEFSNIDNKLLKRFYDLYSFEFIPVMGYLVASDWNSYQYLVESIRVFPNQEEFAKIIRNAGFKFVNYKNLTNGVVAIHSGLKL